MKKIPVINIISITVLSLCLNAYTQNKQQDTTFKKAEKYFFQKKFDMAETMLQQVIRENPENGLAYSYLGDIFLKKKRLDAALNMYLKSIELNADEAENYFRIGQIYYYKKIGNLAIENFQRAYEKDKSLKFAYYHIGLSYLMLLRDKENTISSWEAYLRMAPEDPQYEKIRRVIELLRDKDFVIPPEGSEVSIEEALLLGGISLKKIDHQTTDQQADHEDKKSKRKIEDIYLDDDL